MKTKTIYVQVIPKCVAEFIENNKYGLNGETKSIKDQLLPFFDTMVGCIISMPGEVSHWVYKKGNFNRVVKAIINGYEIEKEPMFVIPTHLRSNNGFQYVVKKGDDLFALGINNPNFKKFKSKFTEEEKKQLPEWCQELAVEVDDD